MSLTAQYDLAKSPNFKPRVQMAALTVALSTACEATGSMSARVYSKRQQLCRDVLGMSDMVSDRFCMVLAVDPTVTTETDDQTLISLVTAVWNKLAGVDGTDVASTDPAF